MNKLLIAFILILSLGAYAEGTFVLNAEGAMLNTQSVSYTHLRAHET